MGSALPDLAECPRGKLDSDGVLYVDDLDVQASYVLTLGEEPMEPVEEGGREGGGGGGGGGGSFALGDTSLALDDASTSLALGDTTFDAFDGLEGACLAASPPVSSFFARDLQSLEKRAAVAGGEERRFGDGTKGDNKVVFRDAKGRVVKTGPEGWIFVLRDGRMYGTRKVTTQQ